MPFNVDLTAYLQSFKCKSRPASTNLQCNSDVFCDPESYAVHASLEPTPLVKYSLTPTHQKSPRPVLTLGSG